MCLCTEFFFLADRGEKTIAYIEAYLKAVGLYRNYDQVEQDPIFSQVND